MRPAGGACWTLSGSPTSPAPATPEPATELERNELLERGIAEFNDGRFLACHETWEALWVDAAYPERLFLLGLAKLGAGFAHALRRNPKGVQSLLADAVRFLRPFGPAYANVDINSLLTNVSAWLEFPGARHPLPHDHPRRQRLVAPAASDNPSR